MKNNNNILSHPLASLVTVLIFLFLATIESCFGNNRQMAHKPISTVNHKVSPKISIHGQLFSKSDTSGVPDIALQAFILAIPLEKFNQLLHSIGFTEGRDSYRTINLSLSEDNFDEYVTAHATSQQNGSYELHVLPGNYMLCLANLNSVSESIVFPVYIYGCLDITVPEGETIKKDMFWGLGGTSF